MNIVPKLCRRCERKFPPTAEYFSIDRSKNDGLRTLCKDCDAKAKQKRRQDNIEEARQKEREQKRREQATNPEKVRARKRQYYADHAEQEREKKREKYKKNPEPAKAAAKKYAVTHKEQVREAKRCRRAENPEKVREEIRRWKKANPERVKEMLKEWKKKNPERAKEISRETTRRWADAHPEEVLEKVRLQRARKAGALGFYTKEDIHKQFKMQYGLCCWCLKPLTKYQRDHLIALARGGTNWARNIVIACPHCNSSKWKWMPFYEWTPPFLRRDIPCSALEWLVFMDVVERFMELAQVESQAMNNE
jgi:5-methylcytosine-specific restriction endonuclease McrA